VQRDAYFDPIKDDLGTLLDPHRFRTCTGASDKFYESELHLPLADEELEGSHSQVRPAREELSV